MLFFLLVFGATTFVLDVVDSPTGVVRAMRAAWFGGKDTTRAWVLARVVLAVMLVLLPRL